MMSPTHHLRQSGAILPRRKRAQCVEIAEHQPRLVDAPTVLPRLPRSRPLFRRRNCPLARAGSWALARRGCLGGKWLRRNPPDPRPRRRRAPRRTNCVPAGGPQECRTGLREFQALRGFARRHGDQHGIKARIEQAPPGRLAEPRRHVAVGNHGGAPRPIRAHSGPRPARRLDPTLMA